MSDMYDIQRLRELGDGDLAFHLEDMADLMEEHRAFKDQNLPPCIPGPPKVREHAQEIKQVSTAAKHDQSKGPDIIAARESSIQSVRFICHYVEMFSAHVNDPSVLDTFGVARVHKAPRNTAVRVPKKFDKFTVSHGKESGTVKIYVNSWEGKGSVEVQICYGAPSLEESWQTFKTFHYCHMTLKGLEPARRAYFRVRLHNDAGVGPWSNVVELIII